MTKNRVTAVDLSPDTDGDNVLEISFADGSTINAAIDPATAQTLVEILQRRLIFWAAESAKNLRFPQIDAADVAVAHQGSEAKLILTTVQMGTVVVQMDDAALQKARAEIGRVLIYRSGSNAKN